ncbi:PilC/PilY family type IV pilus protein [Candidatus Pelagibacter sp.]|nr:PilC/PilY family type IV pilus protein [Candidatus Pelagibacter sp.]
MKSFFLIKIIFILLVFPNYTFGKGLPPGTGSNDVPANLLILLDRSGSMDDPTSGGVDDVQAIAVDSNSGSSYAAMPNSIVKVDYANMDVDMAWKYIPAGNCLIGDIKELRVHNNKLYVIDFDNDRLYRIDLTSTICDWSVSINNPRSMDIKNNILYALGNEMLVYNLNSGTPSKINCTYSGNLKNNGKKSDTSVAIDSSGENLYIHRETKLRRFAISAGDKCPNTSRGSQIDTPGANTVHGFGFKPGSDTIVYLPEYMDRFYQFTLNANRTSATRIQSNASYSSSPSTVSPNKMYVDYPYGLDIDSTNGRIFLISTGGKSAVHVTDYDMQFLKETGSGSRMDGAKEAIKALVEDTSLTSHVSFGFGVWSSATGAVIYSGWDDKGTLENADDDEATPCAWNNCLKVRVNRDGAEQIIKKLPAVTTGGGTSPSSFARLAKEYLLHNTSPIDDDLDCQNTHIVVIGDGVFNSDTDRDAAIDIIKDLFDNKKVKTHMIAYGGDITGSALDDFEMIALAGGTGIGTKSDGVIIADTPPQLKNQLRSRITDIVAENFAFTAPSIPPNKNESSTAVYQSQFKHKSRSQWRGSLIKTTIDANGTLNVTSEWDASKVLPDPDDRKIWSIIDGTDHTLAANKNNNFTAANSDKIKNLLKIFNYEVEDYHSKNGLPVSTRRCDGVAAGVADGNGDDVKGLINFLRGQDYFDYDGDCNLTENRVDRVTGEKTYLGDIYHSELLVVGAPNANTSFTNKSQEAYWRSIKGYNAWAESKKNRKEIIYVGGNDGMLHAFNATTGVEEWAFIPPLITGILPNMVSKSFNKAVAGGTVAIYGVDGSPIVHDMFFISPHDQNATPSWHTILMVPYGRGGKGFTILDVTDPDNPLHLFSVYNDSTIKKVHVVHYDGSANDYEYVGNSYVINELKEARKVSENFLLDPKVGAEICDDTTNNQCYFANQWTLETNPKLPGLTKDDFKVIRGGTNYNGFVINYDANGHIKFTFDDKMRFLAYDDPNLTSDELVISISDPSNPMVGVFKEPGFDYSRLGQTWSQPRILRIPNNGTGDNTIDDDIYVAVMGGGFGGPNPEIGSNLFVINLQVDPVDDFFAKIEKQIQIKDLDNNIPNSTPALPVVITADEISANYTGGLVYLNDFEGKISKFNLTNMATDKDGNTIQMYDSTILFNAGTTKQNGRYMYHSMDAGTTKGSNVFWLFAGTGDYERLIAKTDDIDNLLLGIKDKNFPYYKNITDDPLVAEDITNCSETTDSDGSDCPSSAELGWYIKLDNSRKVTAEPTLTRGKVIFPIFEPTLSVNACTTGKAFICNVTAKCGTPKNTEIGSADDLDCLEVGTGVLSKVVVFGKKLFANIAGEAGAAARQGEKKDLVSIDAATFEIESFRNSWRENY